MDPTSANSMQVTNIQSFNIRSLPILDHFKIWAKTGTYFFNYFCPFLKTMTNKVQNLTIYRCCAWDTNRDRRLVGAEKTTELWLPRYSQSFSSMYDKWSSLQRALLKLCWLLINCYEMHFEVKFERPSSDFSCKVRTWTRSFWRPTEAKLCLFK